MDIYRQKTEGISKGMLFFNVVLIFIVLLMVLAVHNKATISKIVVKNQEEMVMKTPFDNVSLGAKAAFVYDVAEGKVLYKKNEFAQLPLASITKLMMALTASDLLPKNSKITIRKEFLEEDGDTGLLANESWDMSDLLDFSLVASSNDGARSIASVVGAFGLDNQDFDLGRKDFIAKMNVKAKELGLKQTYFLNESGLDVGELSGGYGSAIDVATLIQYMLSNSPEILEATKYPKIHVNSLSKLSHDARNTNPEVSNIPGLLASKTGFTDHAGGNLAVAFDTSIGDPVVIVVLGSTVDGRFHDIASLVKASFEYKNQ